MQPRLFSLMYSFVSNNRTFKILCETHNPPENLLALGSKCEVVVIDMTNEKPNATVANKPYSTTLVAPLVGSERFHIRSVRVNVGSARVRIGSARLFRYQRWYK